MKSLIFCCLLLVTIAPAPAAGQSIEPSEQLRLMVDLARFRGADDARTQVEVFYSFPRGGITYRADSAGFSGAADVTFFITKGDSTVFADRWLVPQTLQDSARVENMSLIGKTSVQLEESEYVFRMILRDRHNASRQDSVALRVPVKPFDTAHPALSDIEFASTIRQGAGGGQFYKNTLDVVPNVGGLYGETQRLYYYAEAYNLVSEGEGGKEYRLRTTVFDAVGREVMSRERPKRGVGESSVLVDQFTVEKLRSGTYTLILSLMDTTAKTLSSSGKKFFVYNPTLGVDSTLLTGASTLPLQVYMSLGEEDLDREFDEAKYAATDAEKDQYSEITGADAKRAFLTDFWRRRPAGLRDIYLTRVEHANRVYGAMGRRGYRSDRGRVYIMYGPPDDIERHPSETETRPYEIWSYNNIQGGVIFVFVLRNPGGDHELVHSTHRNELRDDNWDRVGITR
jgi:GWxTD domain-containing protein